MNAIGEEHLDLLKEIIDSTDAKIVLSSTWRLYEDAKLILADRLLTRQLTIYSQTPQMFSGIRCLEIGQWLQRNKSISRFAIVDDDPKAEIEGNFFLTNFGDGLTKKIANQIINHLNGERNE